MAGNYYMNMAGQRAYNTPNPVNFNYPKLMHAKGSQYENYPKFKEQSKKPENKENENLAKELEKQIKELQLLTKEAKDLAKKKSVEEKMNKSNIEKNPSHNSNGSSQIKTLINNNRLRHSNLNQVSLIFNIYNLTNLI
jgi:hypothetical protein